MAKESTKTTSQNTKAKSVTEMRHDLAELRRQLTLGTLDNNRAIRSLKRQIARELTRENQKGDN